MGSRTKEISEKQQEFIADQKMFFVGTAASEGRVNVSPKGMSTLRVLRPNKVVWLNLTGSGNETAAHLLQNDRITLMFCAFEGKPKILRLYGNAKVYHQRDSEYDDYIALFPEIEGSRQIITIEVDLVQKSCGFGVPLYDYQSERGLLGNWAAKKGKEKLEKYWADNNVKSLDGFETKIFEK